MATAVKKTAARKTAAKPAAKPAESAKPVDAADDVLASFESMSNAARENFDNFVAAFTDNSETLRDQAEELIETCRDSFETAKEHLQSVNAELMSAAREETAEAVEFVTGLARAKTVSEVLELQRDYWTRLFETRMQRSRALTQASLDAARGSFEPFTGSINAFQPAGFEKFFPFAAK